MRLLETFACAAILALSFGARHDAHAAPRPASPCGTNGELQLSALSTPSYSYVRTAAGSVTVNFDVTSPPIKTTGGCDTSLAYVFGNGNGADPSELPYTVSFGGITDALSIPVLPAVDTAIVSAFGSPAFLTAPFEISPPGTGTQQVSFTFTNSASIPVGDYDIEIKVKPETGVGVGEPTALVFALSVTEPTVLDTLAPTVTIQSPTAGQQVCLNGDLSVAFTAIDPTEGGAGTGIIDIGAVIESAGSVYSDDISGDLTISPALPVAAGVLVTATATEPVNDIGAFALTATAEDDADHIGDAVANFTVSANIAPLPPISVPNRQFKTGSTVPIKWRITDCDDLFLPPFDSVMIEIHDAGGLLQTRYAGDGASNIRWELDDFGDATQYITNFVVPSNGVYTVKVFVDDVDGNSALQGSFDFLASTKGGKQ